MVLSLPLIIITILALLGFSVAFYLFIHIRKEKQLVCRVGEHCNVVLYSPYAKTFGIKNEILGMIYYLFAGTLAIFLILEINKILLPLTWILLASGTIGFLFSIYFIYLQAKVIKAWCEYCLTSAVISTLIFLVELFLIL